VVNQYEVYVLYQQYSHAIAC